ncbi:hypothetical protein ISS07_05410 [Candidatus Woesearchaeota archaeon]|nr:hypothetical protein [Candidatus Woesearchaeota archaeon]
MNKRGIELSVNFLVTVIISLTIFMFGVKFIYNIASEATELEGLTTDQLDQRIGELLCESTDRICIGIDRKTIPKGKFDIFGIKIVNIQDSQEFEVQITRPDIPGYTKNNNPILEDEIDWKPRNRAVMLDRNQEKEVGIGIEVPKTTKSGTYIFDVRVVPYDELHKFYVDVP